MIDPREDSPPRRRWRMRVSAIAGGIALVALAAVWTQRKPIAEGFVDSELSARGVQARYRIDRLGFGRQRLLDVVIGDPADPDLVARRVELDLDIGFGTPRLVGIFADGVRVRGRLVDGRVSLGQLDRLLPPPSGKPFTLPGLDTRLADVRLRLETPAGVVGARIDGRGRLNDGFAGTIAATSAALTSGGCTITAPSAWLSVAIADGAPRLRGPVRARGVGCGSNRTGPATALADVRLGPALNRLDGRADLDVRVPSVASVGAARLRGRVTARGSMTDTAGTLDLAMTDLTLPQGGAARANVAGAYRLAGARSRFEGGVAARGARVAPALLGTMRGAVAGTAGSPVAPIARALADSVAQALRAFDVDSRLAWDGGVVRLTDPRLASASGARVALTGMAALTADGVTIDGVVRAGGGGFPDARVRLARGSPDAPITGAGDIRPMVAGGARLAVDGLRFSATPRGNTRIGGRVTLSGPVGDGRVDGLILPIDALLGAGGALAINSDCTPVSFQRLAVSGLVLDPARVRLCPRGTALATVTNGRLGGGATIAAPRLTGRIGGTPLALAAAGTEVTLGTTGFTLRDLSARIGRPDRQTRLDFARLTGRVTGAALTGRFEGGAGQIANVPLLLSESAGDWRLDGGVVQASGATRIRDAVDPPRFQPMRIPDMRLRLAGNDITATGTLTEPRTGTEVADVVIGHDLTRGTGDAVLSVSGITFGPALQPEALTRLTLGVIANVRATVTGEGRIAWSPEGVRSTGAFRTRDADLAAAFGPVTGLTTEVRFSDLLGLVSEPGQVATIASVNPGIAVDDGTVRYRLLAGQRVRVEGGRWPFAGGELVLEPTVLDFAESAQRRLTFTVKGLDAARFVQAMEFENIAATGIFDGTLPMVFDENGGRVDGGRLTVRPGGGTLSYVGAVSNAQLGTYGKLAFDALKSIRYQRLGIEMDGAIDGEIVSRIRFDGVNQGPLAVRQGLVAQTISRLPFRFNITIRAPFRGLLSTARSFTDPSEVIRSQLPPALTPVGSSTESNVQPQESEKMP